MKLRGHSYWLLLLPLLALSFLRGWLRDGFGDSRLRFVVRPDAQVASINLQELRVLAGGAPPKASPLIRGPVRLEADSSTGNLFIIDDGRGETLSELSPSGQVLHVFDEPPAPRMESVSGLAVLPDRIWIADLLGSSLHTLDRKRGHWSSIALAAEPYRVEALGKRLVLMRVVAPQLFDLTDFQGNVSQSFGELVHRQEENALALDGYMVRSMGGIVYTGKYLGVLAAFSREGRLSYLVQTIAPPPYPTLMSEGQRKWLRHGPILASLALAAGEDTLFVLARRRVSFSLRSAVDLYRSRDGVYQKTLLLPATEKWYSIAVARGNLYAASEHRIVRWATGGTVTQTLAPNEISAGHSLLEFHSTGNQGRQI